MRIQLKLIAAGTLSIVLAAYMFLEVSRIAGVLLVVAGALGIVVLWQREQEDTGALAVAVGDVAADPVDTTPLGTWDDDPDVGSWHPTAAPADGGLSTWDPTTIPAEGALSTWDPTTAEPADGGGLSTWDPATAEPADVGLGTWDPTTAEPAAEQPLTGLDDPLADLGSPLSGLDEGATVLEFDRGAPEAPPEPEPAPAPSEPAPTGGIFGTPRPVETPIDEGVSSDDDIMRASEATELSIGAGGDGDGGGDGDNSELAKLLMKVQERLAAYE